MPLVQQGIVGANTITNATGPRVIRHNYKYPYKKPPLVHLGIVGLDDNINTPVRISAEVTGSHTHYVEISLKTWANSHVAWVNVSWLAIGRREDGQTIESGRHKVDSGEVVVQEL